MALKDTFTPVRLYTENDAYHYTLDNRPLQDLQANDEILADAIDALKTKVFVTKVGSDSLITEADLYKTVKASHTSAITLTLPKNLPEGFNCQVLQENTGQITFTPEVGATLVNVDGHTKSKARYALCKLLIISNTDGNSAVWSLSDNTSA